LSSPSKVNADWMNKGRTFVRCKRLLWAGLDWIVSDNHLEARYTLHLGKLGFLVGNSNGSFLQFNRNFSGAVLGFQ
jgi:hypothetical protein